MIETLLEHLAEREAEEAACSEEIKAEITRQNKIESQAIATTTQENAVLEQINALTTTISNLNNKVNGDNNSYLS